MGDRHWLAGRLAVVTGASRGIGAATAAAVAAAGAHVVLAARDRWALDGVAGRIKDAGGQATPVLTDVSDEAARCTVAHSTVTSQDTRTAVTLTGSRASPDRRDADGTVPSGLQAPKTRSARTPGMRRIARYPGGPGSCRPERPEYCQGPRMRHHAGQ